MKQNSLIPAECSWHGGMTTETMRATAHCFPAPGEHCPGVETCQRELACRLRNANQGMRKK
ncbi:hypothetical protein [Endozoicomonas sp. YOMI1]|uniref:hypothetical protein n=1 Tax=Endozoicomonas sp. YOMI1 TaxID=2828739 RepID=UPI0021495C22|nr:hypothetical protein [Endozoicomonas sp. YOMI1]